MCAMYTLLYNVTITQTKRSFISKLNYLCRRLTATGGSVGSLRHGSSATRWKLRGNPVKTRSCPATVSGEPIAHNVTGSDAGKTGEVALTRKPGDLPDKL